MTNEQLYRALATLIKDSGTNYWIAIGVPIGVALIGFAGVWYTARTARKNIDKEIEKIKVEYRYNQMRDNKNFANKILLDKLSRLYSPY